MLGFGLAGWLLLATAWVAVASAVGRCGDEVRAARPSDLRPTIARLVRELDADARGTRAAAAKALIELGPSILPLLPDENAVAGEAARDALRRIRRQLEQQAARGSLDVSRVTLRGRFSLRGVLRIIADQTGNQFDVSSLDDTMLGKANAVDDSARSFWSACDALIRANALAYDEGGPPGRLKLVPARGAQTTDLVDDGGPVRVSVRSARLRSPATQSSDGVLRIEWSLITEPRLRPLFARVAARNLDARLANGNHLKPMTPAAKLELTMGGGKPLRLQSDFAVPSGVDVATVEFAGSFGLEMAAGPQRIEWDKLGSATVRRKRAGGVTVALRGVDFRKRAGGGAGTARVEVSVVYDEGGPAFESYRTWIYHNDVYLEARDGRRIAPGPAFATQQQGDGSIAIEYNFAGIDGEPDAYRFVYVAPTLIAELPVGFRFPRIAVSRSANERTSR